jgi:ketosteroid isomerase-like protein
MTTPTTNGIATLADTTSATLTAIHAFNDALNRHDVDAVMALMTEDCIFENTWPSPDGERYEGQAAVREFWERLIAESPAASFEVEELFAAGDRATQRWRYTWVDSRGIPGHIRGVDVLRVRDGKVAEKFAYVKG